MHKEIRIEYDAYVQPIGDQPPQLLTQKEKHEHLGFTKATHLCALFFLLQKINLNYNFRGTEETTIQLNNLGELGFSISEGLFQTIEVLSDDETALVPSEKEVTENTEQEEI